MYANHGNFLVFEQIGDEKLDGDVRY